ncbi:TPA: hypothetical protein ML375_002933 [Klebsiella variicola]|nr:hypothetical protein [Klebsiella variicola]
MKLKSCLILSLLVLAPLASAEASTMYNACYSVDKTTQPNSPYYGSMMSFTMAQGEGAYDVEGRIYSFEPEGKYSVATPKPAKDGSKLIADDSNKVMAFTIVEKNGDKTHYACYSLDEQDQTGKESSYAYKYLGGK